MKKSLFYFLPGLLTMALSSCFFVLDDDEKNSLYLASRPDIREYHVEDSFSLEGIRVIDGDSGEAISDYTTSIEVGYEFTKEDVELNKKVYVSKKDYKSTYFTINVYEMPKLEITSYPKQEYQVGEYFSLDGLEVRSEGELISDYTCNFSTSNRLNTAGEFDVTISKEGYWPVTYQIEVFPPHTLFVDTLPNKLVYEVGEAFTSEGLIIKDEKGALVSDYSLSISEGQIFKYSGEITIEAKKDNYASATFDVTVNEKDNPDEEITKELNIYYINDTHGAFIRDASLKEAGMSYISSYIKNKTSTDENSLVLSGGDTFQGGYESNETKGKIMIEAMNEIGFDAMAVGNHEFDWGEEYCFDFDELCNFPLLSCNIFYKDKVTRPSWLTPYTVVTQDDLNIGIIGAIQENIGTSIVGSVSSEFYFPDPVSYIQQYSSHLRQIEGCDVVIAVFHDAGFEGYEGSPTKFQALTTIDSQTNRKYVDAMFFAHDHYRKNGTYNGVPYLEAGDNGKYIGEMSITLKGNGVSYTPTSSTTSVINAFNNATTSDPKIDAIVEKDEYREIIESADEVLYTFKNSYLADNFTYIVSEAMYWYVNNNKEKFDNHTVYFASHNKGGVRADVEAGEFTRRDLLKVFPFDNQLSMQVCNSAHLSYMRNNSYYGVFEADNIVYEDGYTRAISITYITEYKYSYNYQVSYKNYDVTAKDALISYLISGVNTTL